MSLFSIIQTQKEANGQGIPLESTNIIFAEQGAGSEEWKGIYRASERYVILKTGKEALL